MEEVGMKPDAILNKNSLEHADLLSKIHYISLIIQIFCILIMSAWNKFANKTS